MRTIFRAAITGVALLCPLLAAAAVAEPETSRTASADEDSQDIEAVRLSVMVGQMAHLLHQPAAPIGEPPKDRAELFQSLDQTVLRFNALLPLACERYPGRIADCSAYHPAWQDKADADASAAIDDAYGRITRAWSAVCATRKGSCPIE